MKEIGGYIELDTYRLPMLHENAIKLNCGRNALWYLVKAKRIHSIWMPKFMCDSCEGVLKKENVNVKYYSIGEDFKPINVFPEADEWLYVVNFYGQLSNACLQKLKTSHQKLIVDNAQAYFQMPIPETDTIYSCRKFFGVADGAILYTDAALDEALPQDESYGRMNFLLGRFERTASEFYSEYVANNHFFANEPIKLMSKLTENLLHAIDYEKSMRRRNENFDFLHEQLRSINLLSIHSTEGGFMYPLMIDNAKAIRKRLAMEKIYIPTLWPNVVKQCSEESIEWKLASCILPLPIDHRYNKHDMGWMISKIYEVIE